MASDAPVAVLATPEQCLGFFDSAGNGRCITFTRNPLRLCHYCKRTVIARPDLVDRLPLRWRQQFAGPRGDARAPGVDVAPGTGAGQR